MKKAWLLVVSLLMIFVLISCKKSSGNISAPKNVALEGDVLVWDNVEEKESYLVKVGNQEYVAYTERFDLSVLGLENGTYTIVVYSVLGDRKSSASNSVKYVFKYEVNKEEVLLTLLQIINPTYTLNMKESDFEEAFYYDRYLDIMLSLNAFVDISVENRIKEEKLVETITFLKDLSNSNEDNPVVILEGFLELGFTPKLITSYIMGSLAIADEQFSDQEITEMFSIILDLYKTNEEELSNLIFEVISYFINVFQVLDLERLEEIPLLIENGILNSEEVFLIYSDIFTALKLTIPSVTSFETLFQALFILSDVVFGEYLFEIDLEPLKSNVAILAKAVRNSFLIQFELYTYFDFEFYQDIMESVERLEDEYDEKEQVLLSLDISIKVYQKMRQFMNENEELLNEVSFEEQKQIILNILDVISPLFFVYTNSASDHYNIIRQNIIDLLDFSNKNEQLVLDVFDKLLEEDDNLLRYIINEISDDFEEDEVLEFLLNVIEKAQDLISTLNTNVNSEFAKGLLKALKYPVIEYFYSNFNYEGSSISEFSDLYDDLITSFASVIVIVKELETDIVTQIENYEFYTERMNTWDVSLEEAILLTQILYLNEQSLQNKFDRLLVELESITNKVNNSELFEPIEFDREEFETIFADFLDIKNEIDSWNLGNQPLTPDQKDFLSSLVGIVE